MNNLTIETEDTFASVLDLAANNDVQGVRKSIEREPLSIHETGPWYGREKGSNHMVLQQRTPLMIASTYGSIDVLKLILTLPESYVNQSCGSDKTTALHCAASGGSINAVTAVKLLLVGGADPNLVDGNGFRPFDLIVVSPRANFHETRSLLEKLLITDSSYQSLKNAALEKKEYPIDPTLPDIKNSVYTTDEFRMYSFKIRPCSRAYSHDWTECPFVHPGENARRRDPRKYHYSCVPCPEFRKGSCRRGDMCEYAHGVFECWLHPAQYRTRLCKDGIDCNRRVCFFAHMKEELRPLYHSTGSAVPANGNSSPVNGMEFLLPGSPSSLTTYSPPMSPSNWPQPNVPSLQLPGSNFQTSRLRSSLNARDFDEEQHLMNELSRRSTLTPSNLEDLFSAESYSNVYSPTHKSAVLNQFQRMSPRNVDPISPISSRASMLSHPQFRSLSSRDLGSNMAAENWSTWGGATTFTSKADWTTTPEELARFKRSSSFDRRNHVEEPEPEPDLSWVQSLVKEPPLEENSSLEGHGASSSEDPGLSSQIDQIDPSALGDWITQMQLDQLVAQ